MSYYQIIGVEHTASQEDIKRAYRKKAIELHPDKNNGSKESEEKFKQVAQAYYILSDEDRRRRYDMSLDSSGTGAFVFTMNEDVEFSDFLQDFFNSMRGAKNHEDMMKGMMTGLAQILKQHFKQ